MTDAGGATTAGLYDSDVLEWSEQQARPAACTTVAAVTGRAMLDEGGRPAYLWR